jgi:hypothetical protein
MARVSHIENIPICVLPVKKKISDFGKWRLRWNLFPGQQRCLPRVEVVSEMIDNYLAGVITAVEPADRLAVTWGSIK